MKRFLVIHPFLFAVFPTLFLFAYNIEEVPASDIFLPIVVAVIGTLILLLVLRLVNNNSNKIAIVTSFLLVLFFSYGYGRGLFFAEAESSLHINVFLTLLWLVLWATGSFFIIKSRKDFSVLTRFLNIVAITLVVISVINIGTHEIRRINLGYRETKEEGGDSGLNKVGNSPDIYYIILDGYSRADVLQEDFNYNNSEFITYLTDKGFYVAPKSRSNYRSTLYSMPSSLNMDYLTTDESETKAIRFEMMRDSRVSRLLKDIGYRYIFIGGNFGIKVMSKYADSYLYREAFGIQVNQFMYSLCETTLLSPFSRFFGSHGANSILYALDVLADVPDIEEPTFVYAHIMCPHLPWLFDGNGPKESKIFEPERKYKSGEVFREGYLGELAFINRRIETLVDEILLESDISPIIILQGDHGTGSTEKGHMRYVPEILNAYYLPEKDNQLLYETISPVNSFRVVFNLYFNTDYELLKDEFAGNP